MAISRYIYYLKKKNTLKILSKYSLLPKKIKHIIQEHIYTHANEYEAVINFELEEAMLPTRSRLKVLKIFDEKAWADTKVARQNCLYLSYLAINLQIKIRKAKSQRSIS